MRNSRRKAPRESALEAWCVRWCRSRKIVVSKLTDPTGITDRVFWIPGGKPVLVEFKRKINPSKTHAELQGWYRTAMVKAGYLLQVVTTKQEFLGLMEESLGEEE